MEDLSAVQQRFVSDVSHELRTPLTTVRMAAEVLHEAREDFDPVAARSAELLQTELDRFEALLTDLLEISRFDAGAAVLAPSEVDLRDDRRPGASSRTAGWPRRTGPRSRARRRGDGDAAEVDARRIERIVRNLLVNAIEHGEGEPIDILVEGDDRAVAVAVRDHGVGFEAESGQAGVPPVLAGRSGPGAYGGWYRAGPGHLDGGRQPARRLADRLGPARAWAPSSG